MAYRISNQSLTLLKNYETGRAPDGSLLQQGQPALTAYLDDAGVPTIGWGHTRGVSIGDTITLRQAEDFLREDVERVVNPELDNLFSVHQNLGISLSQNQVDAFSLLTFNVGSLSSAAPNAWYAIQTGNFDRYLVEASEIRSAGGSVARGLEDRRADEAELFSQGDYARSFDSVGGAPGGNLNPYAPGNYSGSKNDPKNIPANWQVRDQADQDIAFVVDTTGSMGDDIASVQTQARSIIDGIFSSSRGLENSRVAIVGFNDPGVSTILPFTDQVDPDARKAAAISGLNRLSAAGGGDIPELTYTGIETALQLRGPDGGPNAGLSSWRPDADAKKIIVFGDAPAKDVSKKSSVLQLARDLGIVIDDRTVIDPEPNNFQVGHEAISAFTLNALEGNESGVTVTYPVQIFTVAIGTNSRTISEFQEIADETGGSAFQAADATEIVDALLEVINLPIYAISAALTSVTEGNSGSTDVEITVQRDVGTAAADVEIVLSGTADDTDRTLTASTISFAAGETSKTFQLSINGDTDIEDNETVIVSIDSVSETATVGTPSVAITITNDDSANSAPTAVNIDNVDIDENTALMTAVGAISVLDPDSDDTHTLSLINDADGLFALDGSNLVVNGTLDFESATSHEITLRTTDAGGLSFDQTVTINVNNLLETINGSAGDDELMTGIGGDIINLGGGKDKVLGPVGNFFDDQIDGFSSDDQLVFVDETVEREDITVTEGSAILSIDADGDDSVDGSFTLAGDFTTGDFMAVHTSGDTLVTFETFLPDLQEGQALEANLVNGIINQEFLTGDGSTDFQVTLRDMGFAGYDNVVGVYEIDASGNIVDTRILFENANADKSAVAGITDVEAGNRLGFFIVQDAADWAETVSDSDTLSFVNSSGAAANILDGDDISIAVNGTAVDEMVFHSFSDDMNVDDVQHALSGVDVGGESITVGFEDLTGGGDRDYEDVVFHVEMVDDFVFV
jgi:GH24 family phage-related lysozyme (muramidase)